MLFLVCMISELLKFKTRVGWHGIKLIRSDWNGKEWNGMERKREVKNKKAYGE